MQDTPVTDDTAGVVSYDLSCFLLSLLLLLRCVLQPPSPAALPAPVDSAVQVVQQPGGIYAAAVFNGVATPRKCAEVQQQLLADLQEAGLDVQDPKAWVLARYNDPSVKPRFRRNEVLMKLKSFDLWQ